MKINKTNDFDAIRQTRQTGDVRAAGKNKIATGDAKISFGEDKLEFSSRAAEVGNFVDQLKDLPDVRQERIAALREKIATGEFNPSSDAIAEAILKDER